MDGYFPVEFTAMHNSIRMEGFNTGPRRIVHGSTGLFKFVSYVDAC